MGNSFLSGYTSVRLFDKETNEEIAMTDVSLKDISLVSGTLNNETGISWTRGYSGTLTTAKINYDNELMRPLKIHSELKLLHEALKYARHSKKKQRIIKRIDSLSSELSKGGGI